MALPIKKNIDEMPDAEKLASICTKEGEPVIITRDGKNHLVVISAELFEEYQVMKHRLELYDLLAEAEKEAKAGFEGHLLEDVAKELLADL